MSETITIEKFGTVGCVVSDTGRVFIELPQFVSGFKGNYRSVSLKGKRFYVHRLVASCFLPNPEGKAEVNHKNNDHADNSAGNLEWATRSENALHHMGREGVNRAKFLEGSKKLRKRVISSDGTIYTSIAEAARMVGALGPNIIMACQGTTRQCKGRAWAYYTEGDTPPPKPNYLAPGYTMRQYALAVEKHHMLRALLQEGKARKEIWETLGIKSTEDYLKLENLPLPPLVPHL